MDSATPTITSIVAETTQALTDASNQCTDGFTWWGILMVIIGVLGYTFAVWVATLEYTNNEMTRRIMDLPPGGLEAWIQQKT